MAWGLLPTGEKMPEGQMRGRGMATAYGGSTMGKRFDTKEDPGLDREVASQLRN
jgi:hypothetical protein